MEGYIAVQYRARYLQGRYHGVWYDTKLWRKLIATCIPTKVNVKFYQYSLIYNTDG